MTTSPRRRVSTGETTGVRAEAFLAEVERFERYLEAENKAKATITNYGLSLRYFARYAEQQGMSLNLEAISGEYIREWLASLRESGAAPTSINARYRGLKAFFKWLVDVEEELKNSPMAKVKPPRIPEKNPPVIPDDKLRLLFDGLAKDKSFTGVRDHAIVSIMLDNGARLSEVAGLMYRREKDPIPGLEGDLDLSGRRLFVIGKGNKPRILPISAKTASAIDRYLRQRDKHASAADPHLWISRKGGPLGKQSIYQMIAALGDMIDMPGLHPHLFRHTWAHLFKAAGGSLDELQSLGGWADIGMVLRYGRSERHNRAMQTAKRLSIRDRY